MINGINHITISVDDLLTAFEFYRNVLGFKLIMKSNMSAYFSFGRIWFAIVEQKDCPRDSSLYSHIALNTKKKNYSKMRNKLILNHYRLKPVGFWTTKVVTISAKADSKSCGWKPPQDFDWNSSPILKLPLFYSISWFWTYSFIISSITLGTISQKISFSWCRELNAPSSYFIQFSKVSALLYMPC